MKNRFDLSSNQLQNILIKILLVIFIVTLFEVILPFDHLILRWFFGRGGFFEQMERIFVLEFWSLLTVVILYVLLQRSDAKNESRYLLILFLFAQVWTFGQDLILIIKDDSQLTFYAWEGISRYWGLFSIGLFFPYLIGNKLCESLPAKYTEFVESFFEKDLIKKMLIAQAAIFTIYLLFGKIA